MKPWSNTGGKYLSTPLVLVAEKLAEKLAEKGHKVSWHPTASKQAILMLLAPSLDLFIVN